jgi:hypothetical protein
MKIAAITQSHTEPLFLPMWIYHYGRMLGYENLFIIDDTPGRDLARRYRGLNILPRPTDPYDEESRALYVSLFHKGLLQRFDAAFHADTDELAVVDPAARTSFAELIASGSKRTVAAVGFDVLHNHADEPALDLTRPLFRQRRFVRFNRAYCKPMLSNRVLQWRIGFHSCLGPSEIDDRLFLFHLRAVDLDHARARLAAKADVRFSAGMLERNESSQFRFEADRFIARYFPTRDLSRADLRDDMPLSDYVNRGLQNEPERVERDLSLVPDRFADAIALPAPDPSDPSRFAFEADLPQSPSAAEWAPSLFAHCYWRAVAHFSKAGRNAPCPCGSGKRIKHCHGALVAQDR